MRIVIAGGGTGGHIYPALAIAEKLLEKKPSTRIVFVGTANGLEVSILSKFNYEYHSIEVSGFKRQFSLDNLYAVRRAAGALKDSLNIMKRVRPAVVIGTGGYVCGPVVLGAWLTGIKTCIQEQNAVPGVTNRLLARIANRIFLGSPAAGRYFSQKNRVIVTGNPIRSDILSADRREARMQLGLDPDKSTILVSGGSQGAMSINRAMLPVHEKLCRCKSVQVLHITGERWHDEVCGGLSCTALEADNIKIVPYLENMSLALAAADLAVFRAGAVGMSELAARGIPSILVPYPYATDNHQEHNARIFERENAAVLVRDGELTGENLSSLICILLKDHERLSSMADAAKRLGRPDAAEEIADGILEMF